MIYNQANSNPFGTYNSVDFNDVWHSTITKDVWLNNLSNEYVQNYFKYETITQHLTGDAALPQNIARHIPRILQGEDEETSYRHRLQIASMLYEPLFDWACTGLAGRIVNRIADMDFDGVLNHDYGILSKDHYKPFWANAGGNMVSYDNLKRNLIKHFVAYGCFWVMLKPQMRLNNSNGKIVSFPTVEIVNPSEVTNWQDKGFVVRRKLMDTPVKSPKEKPKQFVQYYVYFPTHVEYWVINDKGIPEQNMPKMPYYPTTGKSMKPFTDIHNMPCLPIFQASLGMNRQYAFSMAKMNSYIFLQHSELDYSSAELAAPRITLDVIDEQGDISETLLQAVERSVLANSKFVYGSGTKYLSPDAKAFEMKHKYLHELKHEYEKYFHISAEKAAVERSATGTLASMEKTHSFVAIVLDALQDAENQILKGIVEFEKPTDIKAKKAIHVEYPLNYKKQIDSSLINKEDEVNNNSQNNNTDKE